MSAENVLASFMNVQLPAACDAGTAAAGLPALDQAFTALSPQPEPSCRLTVFEESFGAAEGVTPLQVSIRIPAVLLDDARRLRFCKAFRKALKFSFTSATPRQAYLPAFDYELSDTAPPQVGIYRIEMASSRFWRITWDGPEMRLLIAYFNLFNQGD